MSIGARFARSASAVPRLRGGLAISGFLAATLAVQIWVGVTAAKWTVPSWIPAIPVALCGMVLPLAGSAAASVVSRKAERETNGGALLGGVTLAVVGWVWVAGGMVGFLALEGFVLVCCVVAMLLQSSRRSAPYRWRVVLAPVPVLVATALLVVVPSAPVLRFKLEDESAANHLVAALNSRLSGPCISGRNLPILTGYGRPASVCGLPGQLEIVSARHDGLGLAASPSTFEDWCVRHLDRNWWALANATPDCPWGYHFIPGG